MFRKIDLVSINKMFLRQNCIFSTGFGNIHRFVWHTHQINSTVNNSSLKRSSNLKVNYSKFKKFRIKTDKYLIRKFKNLPTNKMELVCNDYLFGEGSLMKTPITDQSYKKSVLNRIQDCLRSGQKFKLQESEIKSYNLNQTYLLNKVKKTLFPGESIGPKVVQVRNLSTLTTSNEKILPPAKNLYQRPSPRPISTLTSSQRTKKRYKKRSLARTLTTVVDNKTEPAKKEIAVDVPKVEKFEQSFTAKAAIQSKRIKDSAASVNIITEVESSLPEHKSFAQAKNVLHNIYNEVSKEMDNIEYKLHPTYTANKSRHSGPSWNCTYYIKWPEPLKFVATAATKKQASHQAALLVLNWLKKNEKITKDDHPIFINKEQTNDLLKKFIKPLTLCPATIKSMNNMIQIFESELLAKLIGHLENAEANISDLKPILHEEGDIKFKRNFKQIFLKPEKYMAKEKVVLPIAAYKQEFIDLLRENSVVIVKGEPGCGKSTRIPQYVLESWVTSPTCRQEACRIAVTQPRRIAAISLAERVANERNESPGQIVGYQVRLNNNFIQATGRILYCTTGILLRHLQSDPSLSNFSHIILDEAHERDVNTDLLMNLLRKTVKTNPKLKLIVMSATIDTSIFQEYFENAPIMHIPGFTYPVQANFLDDINVDMSKTRKMADAESPSVVHEEVVKLIEHIDKTRDEGAILCFLPGWEDISKIDKLLPYSNNRVVYCLHSRLQHSEQWKIFSKAPPGVRKIILSTNIAETSVTIDDVVYVIDTGIHKENSFDNQKGVMCIDNYWISQASMIQRKGRAGRCQPGESFHLYTKAKYDSLSKFTDPEILKTSLTKIVLDSKVYSNNMNAIEFMSQLLSPPDAASTRRAVRELTDLQLLDSNENLTHLGKALANFQLEPKLAKVLINSVIFKCVTPIVDIITLFSDGSEMFSTALHDKESIKRIKAQAHQSSDHLALMRLFEKWMEVREEYGDMKAYKYCQDANLVQHKLVTMEKLRQIHFDYLYGLKDALPVSDDYSDNDELVKAILFSGVGTVLHHRNFDIVKGRYKRSNVFLTPYNHKATITSESVNFKKTTFPTSLLVYINEIRSNVRRTSLIRECSVISPLAVLLFSNKELTIKNTGNENVALGLKDTKIEFSCNASDAEIIKKCKEVIDNGYQYFIFQITEGGELNKDINYVWDKVLNNINTILLKNSV